MKLVRRICPECKGKNFSANTKAEFWLCIYCGTKINIEHQDNLILEKGENENVVD